MRLRRADSEELPPLTFQEEEAADLRRSFGWQAVRLSAAFLAIFALVYLAFGWTGSAVRFSASRVGDRGVPTWTVTGIVRSANTGQPIPWARVEDDRSGRPPFFSTESDQSGRFELRTFPEAHRLRVSANAHRSKILNVGRVWFLWLPKGHERQDVALTPE